MKAPKCSKCGKAHYSTQRCSAEGANLPTNNVALSTDPIDDSLRPDYPDDIIPAINPPYESSAPTPADTFTSSGSITSEDLVSGGPTNPVHTFAEAKRVAEKFEKMAADRGFKKVNRESSSPLEDAPVSGVAASTGTKQSSEPSDDMLQGPPLTPAEAQASDKQVFNAKVQVSNAEKQKAYRERLKDDPRAHEAYLEANKLRMRKKRNG